MEKVVLYPRAAPSDRLRVWVGVFQATAAPALRWFLGGTEAAPTPLRELSSVRPDELLPAGATATDVPRAFTGVYEFAGLQPDTAYTVEAEAGGERAGLETRTLPGEVAGGFHERFNVLLASCFYQAEDRKGLAGAIISQLKAIHKPHLTLLMGDQVYLDLPTLKDFPDDLAWLADKFERDYALNWRDPLGYAQVLAAAPSVSVPDDHEYWNNYPHPSPWVGNSLTADGRERWRRAALAAYEGFQLAYPARPGEPVIVEVQPLSFFLADTRSDKDPDRGFTMPDAAHERLEE